jgi:Tfp pilus assembly protein PilV
MRLAAIEALKIRARAAITRGMTTPRGSGGAVGRATLADERGWALVETLVSAVLLIVIALAITSSLDTATRASAENKQRSIAATLAEQDQERMRAMDPTVLSNYHPAARTVTTPDGGSYSITSRADWIRDSTDAPESCTTNTTQADYLRITSTVTSGSVGTDTKPVVQRGIVTPAVGTFGPGLGTFAVQVIDRNRNPVPNILVTTSGPKVLSDYTNSLGCVVFGYIPIGSYEGTASNPGWVDQDLNTTAKASGTVNQGQVTLVQVTYDQAGSLDVTLDGAAPQNSSLYVAQPGFITPRTLTFPLTAGTTAPADITGLFPFATSKYAAYVGSCSNSDPGGYSGQTAASALVAPGLPAAPLTVHLPPIVATVKKGSAALSGANVKITSTDTGCTDTGTGITDASGMVTIPMPYGHYRVCANDQATPTKNKFTVTGVNNVAAAGPSPQPTVTIPSNAGGGAC